MAVAVEELGQAGSMAPPRFGYRWTICALLFAATTINYVDRQVLGLLAPTLQRDLGWSESDYGAITSWFSFAYAMGFLGAGRIVDKFGVKKGFAGAIVAWSLAAMSHALATTAGGFSIARAALGFGESGNFPGALKATAEWFPRKERAFATGIFNAGSNVGAIVAPITVPFIALRWGWQWAFIATGALGFIWLAFWLVMYDSPERHPRVSAAELAHIRSDPVERTEPVAWSEVLRHRQAYAFIIGKLLTDPVWWFYLFWLPKFLDSNFGVKLGNISTPIVVVYVIADFGSVFGGWLSSQFIKRGASVNRGRKITMLIAALAMMPTMLAPHMSNMWAAVLLIALATAAHQWWSANLYTTASDMFPRRAVASVIGFGGCAGALGGVAFQRLTGFLLQRDPTAYRLIFIYCGVIYIVALGIIHLIAPRLEPTELRPSEKAS